MNWVRIFTLAFAGKVAGSIFIAACIFLGFGPDKWVEFILGPAVAPWVGRLLLFALAALSFLFVYFGGPKEAMRSETYPNPANFAHNRKRKKSAPSVVSPKHEFGSDVWVLMETASLRDAARHIYGETRDTLAAELAEANNASENAIIEWYAHIITAYADVYGYRPPSRKYEKINLRGAVLLREKFSNDFHSPIHENAKWDGLRVLKSDYPHIVKCVKGLNDEISEARRTESGEA